MNRLATEVATASKILDNELPSPVIGFKRPTHANVLVDVAKSLQRAQTKRAKLRKELKRVEDEIKARKREMKALIAEIKGGR